MPGFIRLDDPSDHGGYMSTANAKFKVNGIAACISGDEHVCPIPGHGTTSVTPAGGTTLKSNGQYVLHVGDKAGCGATINKGSTNTGS